jgi:DNA repair protein RadD
MEPSDVDKLAEALGSGLFISSIGDGDVRAASGDAVDDLRGENNQPHRQPASDNAPGSVPLSLSDSVSVPSIGLKKKASAQRQPHAGEREKDRPSQDVSVSAPSIGLKKKASAQGQPHAGEGEEDGSPRDVSASASAAAVPSDLEVDALGKLMTGMRIAPPTLRDYQQWMVNTLWKLCKSRIRSRVDPAFEVDSTLPRSVLVYLPTGGGKTRVACEVISKAYRLHRKLQDDSVAGLPPARTLFVVNRTQLVAQTVHTLEQLGIASSTDIGLIQGGKPMQEGTPIVIATIQALLSRYRTDPDDGTDALPFFDLVFLDEAHCAVAGSYYHLCRHVIEAGSTLLGLSATPVRLDPAQTLGVVFERLMMGPSVSELVNRKVLVPPVVIVPPSPSASAAKPDAFAPHLEHGVSVWLRHAKGLRTIAFCSTIAESAELARCFESHDVSARCLTSETSESDRDEWFTQLHEGTVRVLSSVGVLSEGFDEPRVGCVMLFRTTKSRGLYIQQVGRGLRSCASVPDPDGIGSPPQPKEHCIVIDIAGNTLLHGPVTGPSKFSLEVPRWQPRSLGDSPPPMPKLNVGKTLTSCPKRACPAVFHELSPVCPLCGCDVAKQRAIRLGVPISQP